MELIKDYIRLNSVMPTVTMRNVFEFDCIVPDNMPDVIRILAVEGTSFVENVRIDNTFAVTDFTINYNILYMSDSDEAPVKSFNTIAGHSMTGDMPSVTRELLLRAGAVVENIEFTLINSRKLSVRATVRVDVNTTNNMEQGIATDIAGIEGVQILTNQENISICTENITSCCDVSTNLELPGVKQPFAKLLRSDPHVGDVSYTVTGDKMQIRGNLSICTLYIADGAAKPLQIIENQIPFTHIVDVEVRDESQCRIVDYAIKNFDIDIIEDSDGIRRVLNVNSSITFNIRSYSLEQINILEDAYSLNSNLQIVKEEVCAAGNIEELTSTFVLKDVANNTDDLPGIKEIVNVTCKPGIVESTCQDGAVLITGFIFCNVLYLTDDPEIPVSTFNVRIPFEQIFEHRNSNAQMQANMCVDINHISFGIISENEIELRISVTARGIITTNILLNIITDCVEVTDTDGENTVICCAPILLYIVQPGDSIWKIAKKYRTDPELLKKINRLPEPYIIYPGQKLLISK